jgi:hypothetical protein
MRNKWTRRVKRFIELFTTGGTIYSVEGIAAHVSRDGGFEVPPDELERLLDMHLEKMERLKSRLRAELALTRRN